MADEMTRIMAFEKGGEISITDAGDLNKRLALAATIFEHILGGAVIDGELTKGAALDIASVFYKMSISKLGGIE